MTPGIIVIEKDSFLTSGLRFVFHAFLLVLVIIIIYHVHQYWSNRKYDNEYDTYLDYAHDRDPRYYSSRLYEKLHTKDQDSNSNSDNVSETSNDGDTDSAITDMSIDNTDSNKTEQPDQDDGKK